MNIAIFYDLPAGGASRTMEEVSKVLSKKHKLTIFHDPKSYFAGTNSRLLKDLESIWFQSFKQRRLAQEIDIQKFDLCFVSHDRHSQAPWILRFLKTPTVFLCQEPTRAYFEEFLHIDPHLPIHKKLYESLNRKIRKQIEITNAHFATKIVANSRYSVESIFRSYGINSTPIHLGIDTTEYYPEKIAKKNQVVVVGNNEPQKDLPLAVYSVALINKNIRPTLVIASPRNSDMREIERLAKKKLVRLNLLTGLDQNGLRKIYSQSKLTLALARLEPFGLSVIESMACGTPVVAVNEGGFKETVTDNISGLLIERDPQLIAEAISTLLSNPKMISTMGNKGTKDAVSTFTWDNTVKKLEKIFNETKNIRHHG